MTTLCMTYEPYASMSKILGMHAQNFSTTSPYYNVYQRASEYLTYTNLTYT